MTLSWRKISKAFALTASGLDSAGEPPASLIPSRWSRTGLSCSGSMPTSLQARADFLGDRFGGVGLEDAAIAAQQVESEQIGDRGAVGKAPSFDPGRPPVGELPAEFGEQPGLADAGLADDADRLAVPVFDLPQEIVQDRAARSRGRQRSSCAPGRVSRRPERRCETPSRR